MPVYIDAYRARVVDINLDTTFWWICWQRYIHIMGRLIKSKFSYEPMRLLFIYGSMLSISLHIVVEGTSRRVVGVAPLWHPVVWYEMTAVWKHLLKHLSVVVGFLSVWYDTTELCASLSKHLLVNLCTVHVKERNELYVNIQFLPLMWATLYWECGEFIVNFNWHLYNIIIIKVDIYSIL